MVTEIGFREKEIGNPLGDYCRAVENDGQFGANGILKKWQSLS
jgi:hypothetical protein